MPTSQTKDAINAMLRAGFRRSEFTVNVERIYRGKKAGVQGRPFYEYGEAQISLTGLTARRVDRVAELLPGIIEQELGVTYFISGERVLHVWLSASHKDRGRVSFSTYRDCDTCGKSYRSFWLNDTGLCYACQYPNDND